MKEKLYAARDAMQLDKAGSYYCKHVSAMTGEGLHSKGDIAAELGFRDMRIDQLLKERDALAVENAELNGALNKISFTYQLSPHIHEMTTIKTPATYAAIANIRASEAKEIYESILDNPAVTDMGSLVDWIESYANNSVYQAAQLRKEAGK